MRISAVTLVLLWQMGSAAGPSPSRHLRYQREVVFRVHVAGQACVVLDGAVFAHTASMGAGDIRIYGLNAQREFEVPFAMTESGPATVETQTAAPGNIAVRNGELVFDLAMPGGYYTDVDLDLNAKNFIGAAQVAGVDPQGRATPLGTFAVFDLSAQGLARSTVLSLPDSGYPMLHVALRLTNPEGQPMSVTPSTIAGATVPPSREGQTLYTTIASTSAIEQQGHWSTATMTVPAHVPVERARFVLSQQFHADFLRDATVAASPMETGLEALGAAEGVSGHIFHVTHDAIVGVVPAIDSQAMTISTVIGANLRAPATVTASVDNGASSPLPIARVDLQMRERRLCFEARPDTSYTLRYGDAELSGPSYGYARHFVASAEPTIAALGPEEKNPNYVPAGTDEVQKRPGRELPWLLLIGGVAIAGVTALQYMRHKREGMGEVRLQLTRTKACPLAVALLSFVLVASAAAQQKHDAVSGTLADLAAARQELAAKHYVRAKELYRAYLHTHPESVDAQFGLADAELGLREFEAAEWDFRRVVAAQPQNWVAHKNLVIIEAELGRWDEFERERAVLRAARERGAPGISARESDVIDSFEVNGHRWIVREYFEPVGRSQTRYNFERFSPEGHAEEYISLEPTAAAEAALKRGDVHIGAEPEATPHSAAGEFSLNWYSGKGHGTIARYPKGEPSYERLRADLMRWLRRKP